MRAQGFEKRAQEGPKIPPRPLQEPIYVAQRERAEPILSLNGPLGPQERPREAKSRPRALPRAIPKKMQLQRHFVIAVCLGGALDPKMGPRSPRMGSE